MEEPEDQAVTCLVCDSEMADSERITCDECYVGGAYLADDPHAETYLLDPFQSGPDRERP